MCVYFLFPGKLFFAAIMLYAVSTVYSITVYSRERETNRQTDRQRERE